MVALDVPDCCQSDLPSQFSALGTDSLLLGPLTKLFLVKSWGGVPVISACKYWPFVVQQGAKGQKSARSAEIC